MKYTLKLSKWVNGDSVGRGGVLMLNAKGFSCCLGQFALQAGVSCEALRDKDDPNEVACHLGRAYDERFVLPGATSYFATGLAIDCIRANDSVDFAGHRVERLREVLEAAGHELEVLD